ncbi:hypothetical protein NDU88_004901 [Pleurodeles waltl]|uniref:Uncharacterized protein n=1 Tax=Pleurodeles waltl TaxID=8319 RepID=A0AAV7LJH2_PLEWA|nr:hypothetical protein NDU88_004901 [Pleurodeles waltl]
MGGRMDERVREQFWLSPLGTPLSRSPRLMPASPGWHSGRPPAPPPPPRLLRSTRGHSRQRAQGLCSAPPAASPLPALLVPKHNQFGTMALHETRLKIVNFNKVLDLKKKQVFLITWTNEDTVNCDK